MSPSRSPRIIAVVADSPYADQQATVARLNTLTLGPLRLPRAPLAPWAVDRLLEAPLSRFSPVRAAAHLAPRGRLLMHSRHDLNPTTPLAAALALRRAAGAQAHLWIAPYGGHAKALSAQPAVYAATVLAFFHRYGLK